MKRILLSFLQIGLLSFVCQSLSAHDFYVGRIYYNYLSETDKTVAVTFKGQYYFDYDNEYSGNVVIPESVSYNGTTYSVTSIGGYAFFGCTGLTSIEIPSSVTSIGDYAFSNCTSLTSIEIPNSVTSIGNSAFSRCTGLISIEIPNSVTSIGWDAFYRVKNVLYSGSATGSPWGALTVNGDLYEDFVYADAAHTQLTAFIGTGGDVKIPSGVTSIGNYAFDGCTGLTSIVIPSSVTSIGYLSFSGCTGLTSIEIPNSVTSIGSYAFYGCTGKLSIHCNIGNADNSNYGWFCGSKFDEVKIGEEVSCIGDFAFDGCTGLTSIEIPNSVTNIGDYAFSACKLRDIQVLGETPASISESSFSGQSQYHTTLFVPFGCYDSYAYDDTYWYKFIHIKESASSTQNLSPKQAYALKSATTRSYIVYDAVNDAVGDIALDANIDEDNANHNWQVIEQEGKTYIYNIGAKKYLYAEASVEAASVRISPSSFASNAPTLWKLSSTPIAVSLSSGESGINIENSGEWLFVLNPTLAVDENVSAIEQLETNGKAISDKAYTLQGTQTSAPVENGLYIRNGKKVMMK